MTSREIDTFIDTFVERANASARSLKLRDEVAPSVAMPSADDPCYWTWSVRRFEVSWMEEVEARLPRKFPAIFQSFVTRYIFPEFEWAQVLFFENTPETIGYSGHELRVAVFQDARLFEVLSSNGYVQFGQPSTGSYDPVCFAPSGRQEDSPIVRIDHEDILIRGQVHVVETFAPSFLE